MGLRFTVLALSFSVSVLAAEDTRPPSKVFWKKAIDFCVRLFTEITENYRPPTSAEILARTPRQLREPLHETPQVVRSMSDSDAVAISKYVQDPIIWRDGSLHDHIVEKAMKSNREYREQMQLAVKASTNREHAYQLLSGYDRIHGTTYAPDAAVANLRHGLKFDPKNFDDILDEATRAVVNSGKASGLEQFIDAFESSGIADLTLTSSEASEAFSILLRSVPIAKSATPELLAKVDSFIEQKIMLTRAREFSTHDYASVINAEGDARAAREFFANAKKHDIAKKYDLLILRIPSLNEKDIQYIAKGSREPLKVVPLDAKRRQHRDHNREVVITTSNSTVTTNTDNFYDKHAAKQLNAKTLRSILSSEEPWRERIDALGTALLEERNSLAEFAEYKKLNADLFGFVDKAVLGSLSIDGVDIGLQLRLIDAIELYGRRNGKSARTAAADVFEKLFKNPNMAEVTRQRARDAQNKLSRAL